MSEMRITVTVSDEHIAKALRNSVLDTLIPGIKRELNIYCRAQSDETIKSKELRIALRNLQDFIVHLDRVNQAIEYYGGEPINLGDIVLDEY